MCEPAATDQPTCPDEHIFHRPIGINLPLANNFAPVNRMLRSLGLESRATMSLGFPSRGSKEHANRWRPINQRAPANTSSIAQLEQAFHLPLANSFAPVNRMLRSLGLESRATMSLGFPSRGSKEYANRWRPISKRAPANTSSIGQLELTFHWPTGTNLPSSIGQ